MSLSGKVESGAELLVRLGPRPSLHSLKTDILGFEPSAGDILELCGAEGVGKTELLLHFVISSILPTTNHSQCHLPGNMTQVIWVDCDLKFSVLRLAVLFEQRILKLEQRSDLLSADQEQEMISTDVRENGSSSVATTNKGCNGSVVDKVKGIHCRKSDGKIDIDKSAQLSTTDKTDSDTEKQSKPDCLKLGTESGQQAHTLQAAPCILDCSASVPINHQFSSRSSNLQPATVLSKSDQSTTVCRETSTGVNMKYQCASLSTETASSTYHSSTSHFKLSAEEVEKRVHQCASLSTETASSTYHSSTSHFKLSAEEVEKRVHQCLQCVHVMCCTSSQQLICTLHSLQSAIAANRNVALIVVDSVSAFFSSDSCVDFGRSPSFLHKNMSHIASVLKKIADSYGVLVAASKQLLMSAPSGDRDDSDTQSLEGFSKLTGAEKQVRFLGKAWNNVVTQQLMCSRSGRDHFDNKTRYVLTGAFAKKEFTISESGVHFLN